jgi:hypothetical protein
LTEIGFFNGNAIVQKEFWRLLGLTDEKEEVLVFNIKVALSAI